MNCRSKRWYKKSRKRWKKCATMLALMSVAQAKNKPAPATESVQNSEQTKSMPNLGTIIVYRQ